MPSKDGTAQRSAKEVEGLKDYVRLSPEDCGVWGRVEVEGMTFITRDSIVSATPS